MRRGRNLSHHQLLGYAALVVLTGCVLSGFVLTIQGTIGPRISVAWDMTHLICGIGVPLFTGIHLATLAVRTVHRPEALAQLRAARTTFYRRSAMGAAVLLLLCVGVSTEYSRETPKQAFPEDYSWRFGDDRPFAPSKARLDYGDQLQTSERPSSSRSVYFSNKASHPLNTCSGPIEPVWCL